jgi:hypothetical protein
LDDGECISLVGRVWRTGAWNGDDDSSQSKVLKRDLPKRQSNCVKRLRCSPKDLFAKPLYEERGRQKPALT